MEQSLIHRKERIILDTIEAIDRYGIQAVSTREIAKKQGVSERIIFKHFPKKSDLILAVLDYFSQYDSAIVETAHSKKMRPREAITYFIDSYSVYYENYPAITAITQSYDILRCDPEFKDKIKAIFNNRVEFILEQIKEAQKSGGLPEQLDSEALTAVIMGSFNAICLKWRMEECSFPLRERNAAAINMVLDSFGLV